MKYYSLLWGLIITVVQIHGHGGCFEEERMGLLQFKEFVRTSGADADRLLPSWVDHASQSDCCGWERVTCNSTTGHVIELSLHNIKQLYNYTYNYYDFNYEGEIFYYWDDKIWLLNVSIFRAFKELRSLNLSLNEIGGWIENEGMLASYFIPIPGKSPFFFFFEWQVSNYVHYNYFYQKLIDSVMVIYFYLYISENFLLTIHPCA